MTSRSAQMSLSRATVREVSDGHLMQEVKYADVFHSETPSDFERWQMVGMTAVPIKQQQDQNQKPSKQAEGEQGDWNHDQPTGPAAEALMLYLNGSRSHPVALVDDRRVRPYNMKEGEGAHYAPDGSEQMTFFNKDGAYLVSLDGKSVAEPNGKNTRMASLRHVTKKMQTHKIEQGQKQDDYKHEGDQVNTEVRCIKDRIEFRAGDTVVGYYEKSSDTWYFKGKIAQMEFTQEIDTTAPKVNVNVSNRFQTYGAGRTMLGLDVKDDEDVKVDETVGGPAKKTFAKV